MLNLILAWLFVLLVLYVPTLRAFVRCEIWETAKVFFWNSVLVLAMYGTSFIDRELFPDQGAPWIFVTLTIVSVFSFLLLFTDEVKD